STTPAGRPSICCGTPASRTSQPTTGTATAGRWSAPALAAAERIPPSINLEHANIPIPGPMAAAGGGHGLARLAGLAHGLAAIPRSAGPLAARAVVAQCRPVRADAGRQQPALAAPGPAARLPGPAGALHRLLLHRDVLQPGAAYLSRRRRGPRLVPRRR